VRRHEALIPLSHDHHDALVAARRLRRSAGSADAAAGAEAFLDFFAEETVQHFRQEEEELLFPHVVDREEARELVLEALLDHQRLHALAAELGARLAGGHADPALMRSLGETLEAHVRLEERRLFPLIEQLLSGETLAGLALRRGDTPAPRRRGSGPLWGTASEELNATLLSWNAGEGTRAHVNEERDVLMVVLGGSMTVQVDEDVHVLGAGETTIIGKGHRRTITAGPDGARYLSVHRRRAPLQIRPAPAP
jgi:quercetin dioxygenase-like cupin family protein/iron-sulfur cluster repair protein YtfE (RIC family)